MPKISAEPLHQATAWAAAVSLPDNNAARRASFQIQNIYLLAYGNAPRISLNVPPVSVFLEQGPSPRFENIQAFVKEGNASALPKGQLAWVLRNFFENLDLQTFFANDGSRTKSHSTLAPSITLEFSEPENPKVDIFLTTVRASNGCVVALPMPPNPALGLAAPKLCALSAVSPLRRGRHRPVSGCLRQS